MNEELLEKARQLRAAGVPVAEIERYLASKSAPADDTVEIEAGYPERLATTLLKGAQVIPGVKSLEALAGSLGSKLTDHPVSYSDARAGLEEQTDRMKPGLGFAAELASSPVTAPLFALRGLSALSPAMGGAAYGGASQALDINPDETLESHLLRAGAGAAAGGILGKVGDGVLKFAKSPPGTTRKVAGKLFPRVERAAKAWETATETPPPTARPKVRLEDAGTPKPAPKTLEEILGTLELVPEAESAAPQTLEEAIAKPKAPRPQRHRTKAQFDYFADWSAKQRAAKAAESADAVEPALEDLLRLQLDHIKKGGSLKSASDALKLVRRP
jgi:hypothetical protein